MSDWCHVCDTSKCGDACARLEIGGIPRKLAKRIVFAGLNQANSDGGECRVTQDEFDLCGIARSGAIELPGNVQFVVDMSKVKCCGCEDEVFEVQANDVGWSWATFLPNGDSAWRCGDCSRSDVDQEQF